MVLMVVGLALLASGTGYYTLHHHNAVTCRDGGRDCQAAAHRARTMGVRIDSGPTFGLFRPTAMTMGQGRIWIADADRDSVTEFGWKSGAPARV